MRADIVLRAHEVGAGMTDFERIALGAALIDTVLNTERHQTVLLAARHVREHGEALQAASWDGARFIDISHTPSNTIPGGPHTGQTTHGAVEQTVPPEIPAGVTAGRPGRSLSSSLGATWARFRAVEARVSDSWLGDGIGVACVWIIGLALLFAPLIWG
jgi:hypothetical protein